MKIYFDGLKYFWRTIRYFGGFKYFCGFKYFGGLKYFGGFKYFGGSLWKTGELPVARPQHAQLLAKLPNLNNNNFCLYIRPSSLVGMI